MCSSMGVEVTDICMDKESDCIIVYSNGVSHDSNNETFPSHHNVMLSYVNGDPELQGTEEGMEAKEYEVEQSTLSSNLEAGLSEEKAEQETTKTKNNRSRVPKTVSKLAAANVQMKHTVPQPFALATGKHASCGTLLLWLELDAGTAAHEVYVFQQPQLVLWKPLQPNNKKHPDHDACSVSSTKRGGCPQAIQNEFDIQGATNLCEVSKAKLEEEL
ncbi:hypothetical protein DITRI_Ditri08aG0036500 [Diplodiscus trichospermus]